MSKPTPQFNATTPFAAKVAAAAARFAKNPSDLRPFTRLEKGLMRRRTGFLRDAFASPTTGSSFKDFAAVQAAISEAREELKDAAPLEAPAMVAGFVTRFQQLLETTAEQSTRNREEMIAFSKQLQGVTEDYVLFESAVQKLATQYAGNPQACHDDIKLLAESAAQTSGILVMQAWQVSGIQDVAQQQLEQLTMMRHDMTEKLLGLKDATQAVEAFKDFIDSCSTGTRSRVTVARPLSLKPRQASFSALGLA